MLQFFSVLVVYFVKTILKNRIWMAGLMAIPQQEIRDKDVKLVNKKDWPVLTLKIFFYKIIKSNKKSTGKSFSLLFFQFLYISGLCN